MYIVVNSLMIYAIPLTYKGHTIVFSIVLSCPDVPGLSRKNIDL